MNIIGWIIVMVSSVTNLWPLGLGLALCLVSLGQ